MLKKLEISSYLKFSRRFSSSVLSGTSRNFLDAQYTKWLKDPKSVDTSWNEYFRTTDLSSPSSSMTLSRLAPSISSALSISEFRLKVDLMIDTFRSKGHYIANLDPLKLTKLDSSATKYSPNSFSLNSFGFNEQQISQSLTDSSLFLSHNHLTQNGVSDIRSLRETLFATYCGSTGFEFDHIESKEERDWLHQQVESPQFALFSRDEKKRIFEDTVEACEFERFLAKKWSVQKRFGLEGNESMIPGIKAVIETAAGLDVFNVVVGMPHRGRLNTLANVLQKDAAQIFAEFAGAEHSARLGETHKGDVKYHSGYSSDQTTPSGKKVHISLIANPSHLEACNTVVLGKTRAKQEFGRDVALEHSMGLLIHGDAAFYGQGVVYETLMMSDFKGFDTGGVVHIICNNQIGYTTDPLYTRKSRYCTNVAKSFGAAIFHVNAEDVEAVVATCRLAAQYRQTFKKDVIIDMIGYRKFGHNEGDEPRFTQPQMYSRIFKKKNHQEILREKLIDEKVISAKESDQLVSKAQKSFADSFEESKSYKPPEADWMEHRWDGFHGLDQTSQLRETGIPAALAKSIGAQMLQTPENFRVHPRLAKYLSQRKTALRTGQGYDWGLAEGLAFGSLLREGCRVRLSGEDVERGTFSHRHSVLVDQTDRAPANEYYPLHHLAGRKADYTAINSPLSEFGVLGFEYGYSLESPKSLVLWEAQFGDFSNNAQGIFDQFISSGESKWLRQSGLVVLLPHAYEGGGPEHSSARVERFLQMCDEHPTRIPSGPAEKDVRVQLSNWQVVNCSSPANYFHALRRQYHRSFRKPLVVFSPKSLLKLRECVSPLEDFTHGRFKWVISEREETSAPEKIRKVVFCSGKVYYDLAKQRRARRIKDVVLITVEQLCPFPFEQTRKELEKYENASVCWVQEEPMNMGAYSFVLPRLQAVMRQLERTGGVKYVGRPPSASTATGFGMKEHNAEIAAFMGDLFD